MKHILPALVVCAVLLCAARPARADDKATGLRADLIGQIEYAQKEIMDLENAIPQNKMTWRPNKEVRSVSEVYMHIAFGNYLLAKFAGVTLPEGISVTNPKDETNWEKTTTDKKVIAEKLATSFSFLKDAIAKMPDTDLDKPVTFFGLETNVRGMLLTALSHMHEHLGQSIAYARMNNIVPPWTAAQQAADAKKATEAKK